MTDLPIIEEPAFRTKEAVKVTWIGFFVNAFLSLAKLTAGYLGHSAAMIADAVHSISDFATDIVVIIFVRISGKECDESHRYGHGKFETFATFLISLALMAVGIGLFIKGTKETISVLNGHPHEAPSMIALIAAAISIVVKEILFQYTRRVGAKINSQAVIANAWHHRSDAFSSIGTLIGISGAIFLGGKWVVLDPLACIVVSIFIVKVSVQLGLPSINELLERSLSQDIEDQIIKIIVSTPKVISYHKLKTRKIGQIFVIDVHIQLPKDISFVESHKVASEVEKQLRLNFGKLTQISIHTEPA
jgi:cation diffusion facilitator family transporter